MRRLIAILMMLWLPLQALAGIGVPACASPMQATSAQDAAMSPNHEGASHGHHALAGTDAMSSPMSSQQAADDGAVPLQADSADRDCGDCAMACAALAVQEIVSSPQRMPGERPSLPGDESFASAAGNRALEPPIAAA